MRDDRSRLGGAGEALARWWLGEQGLRVTAGNVAVGGGEIDLLALDDKTRVAIEVRAITGSGDPIDAIDSVKRRHVARLAGRAGAARVDFVGVAFRPWGVELHWLPG